MVKMTFTFDEETVKTLRQAAARSKKPQSVVVREAIREYAQREDRMSAEEIRQKLEVFDRMVRRIPKGSQSEANAEIAGIRAARKTGGRRTRVE